MTEKLSTMLLRFLITFLTCFIGETLLAQEATLVAGGNAAGSDGSVSWSVGQVDYLNVQGSSGAITEGVQQPFELFPLSVEGDLKNPWEVTIFPNPTTANAVIRFSETHVEEFVFVLLDMRGAILQSGRIDGREIELNVSQLPAAVYKVQINSSAGTSQVFKLVKH
jgi:hypothetical protein